jgi:hypothetical protein
MLLQPHLADGACSWQPAHNALHYEAASGLGGGKWQAGARCEGANRCRRAKSEALPVTPPALAQLLAAWWPRVGAGRVVFLRWGAGCPAAALPMQCNSPRT